MLDKTQNSRDSIIVGSFSWRSVLKEHQLKRSDQEVLEFLLSILRLEQVPQYKLEDSLLSISKEQISLKFCLTLSQPNYLRERSTYSKKLCSQIFRLSKHGRPISQAISYLGKLLEISIQICAQPARWQWLRFNKQLRWARFCHRMFMFRQFT